MFFRYLKDGASKTDFLGILPLPDGKADTITATLVTFIIENMGLQLALAVGQAAKGVTYLQKFKDIVGDLHRFYEKSSIRTIGLKAIQELLQDQKLKLVEAKDVRWLSHDKATTTLRKCLPSIYTSLERGAEERNDSKAAGLSVFTQDYRFVMAIHMMCDILPHLTALSCAMQKRDAVYTTVRPLVNGTLSILQGMRTKSAEHYEAAPARVRQLIDEGFKVKSPSEDELETFHEKIYLPFLDNLIENLEDRFPDLLLLEKFGAFAVSSSEDDLDGIGEAEIKELASHFSEDEGECCSNWRQVRASFQGSDLSADQTMNWLTTNLANSHPVLYRLASVGHLLPTSTADCEKGFSCMKRVKTENRNRLSAKILNSLLAISLQGPPISNMNFAKAVKIWLKQQTKKGTCIDFVGLLHIKCAKC